VAGTALATVATAATITLLSTSTTENASAENPPLVSCDVAGVVAPEPDPCAAAQGAIADVMLRNLINAKTVSNWRRDNPGEWTRLTTFMQTPNCPTPANSAQPSMRTRLGGALVNAIQAYACARGTGPLVFPAPDPAPTGPDKTPPSQPGPVTVTP
jgi:hypothetical protein